MKYLLTFVLGCASLAHADIVCEARGSNYRCYRETISLIINQQNNTFTFSSYYDVVRDFCGWPPAGYDFKGEVSKINSTYLLTGTHGETAEFKLEGSQGYYSGLGGDMIMSCR